MLFTNKDYLRLIWFLLQEGFQPSSVLRSQLQELHVLLLSKIKIKVTGLVEAWWNWTFFDSGTLDPLGPPSPIGGRDLELYTTADRYILHMQMIYTIFKAKI